MIRGYILLSAIGVLILIGIVSMFALREIGTTSAIKSAQIIKTKTDIILLASETIVLDEILKHNFKKSCLNKFEKSFSNGEVIATYELLYSDDIGLCSSVFSSKNSVNVKEQYIMVKAVVSAKTKWALIRKCKNFNLKI